MADTEGDGDDGMIDGLDAWVASGLNPWATLAIFAPRGSGKSFCLRYLLYQNKDKFPAIVVICPSEKANKFYQLIIPDLFIYDEFDESTLEAIRNIYERQTRLMGGLPSWMSSEYDTTVLIIMDDCMTAEKSVRNSVLVKELYKQGRHFKFGLWVVVQYLNDLPPDLRLNLDYTIILGSAGKAMQYKFYDFLGGFDDKHQFAQVMKQYTNNFGCLVKDNKTHNSTEILKTFFWYKAKVTPKDFKMNPDQWAYHHAHYLNPDAGGVKTNWEEWKSNPTVTGAGPGAGKPGKGVKPAKPDRSKPFKMLRHYDKDHNLMDPSQYA
jgi:hypothetical protein